MAVAIRGAEIVKDYEGSHTSLVTYRKRCDICGYVSPEPPIAVSVLLNSTEVYGAYHAESFVCPFCENHQVVEIQG